VHGTLTVYPHTVHGTLTVYPHTVHGTLTVYPHTVHGTHALQVTIYSHNTDNVLYNLYVSTFNQVCNFYLSTDCGYLMMVSL